MNDWLNKYKTSMDQRYITYKIALDLLFQLPTHRIVETGCVRMKNDWGAGYSTMLFGEFCEMYGGSLISVDNVPSHIAVSKEITEKYNKFITYVESDSVKFLHEHTDLIDLLYLDSMDVPLEPGANLVPCQEHNLREFQAAEPALHSRSVVLLDDYFNGNGKPKFTVPYMLERGWRLIWSQQQQILVR